MTGKDAGEIEAGAQLIAFAQAVVEGDKNQMRAAREQLVQQLSVPAMVDAAGVCSNFQRMVRISDATGIKLGDYEAVTKDLRADLGINQLERK